MNELGYALTELGSDGAEPRVMALFVYNCNAAAVAPDAAKVLEGLRREDLFTVVHEQFFTDTTDYADIVLPATTFLEAKDVMGAYGHLYAQISEMAIEPLGEARSNVELFCGLGQEMGFGEEFDQTADDLIAVALDSEHPWFEGVTKERLERKGHVGLNLPRNERGEVLPFSTASWFRTWHGKGVMVPVPEFVAAVESRHGAEGGGPYPLEFLPRKADNYMNTTFANIAVHQQMERRTAGVLEMHAKDAGARGIATGDRVRVFNGRGRITLTARVGDSVGAGVVSSRLDWHKLSEGGANVNMLTSERLTDIGGGATFYSTLVEVEKVDDKAMAAD